MGCAVVQMGRRIWWAGARCWCFMLRLTSNRSELLHRYPRSSLVPPYFPRCPPPHTLPDRQYVLNGTLAFATRGSSDTI